MHLNLSNFQGRTSAGGGGGTSLGPKMGTSVKWGGLAKFCQMGGPPSPPRKKTLLVHRNCVAVPIYWLFSAASHHSITALQVKMNLTFMRHRNAVTSQFLCSRVQCGTATQLQRSMNRPLIMSLSLTLRPLSRISSALAPLTVQCTAIFSFLLIPKDLTV